MSVIKIECRAGINNPGCRKCPTEADVNELVRELRNMYESTLMHKNMSGYLPMPNPRFPEILSFFNPHSGCYLKISELQASEIRNISEGYNKLFV